jgi:outer membrane protein assembly factor BamB
MRIDVKQLYPCGTTLRMRRISGNHGGMPMSPDSPRLFLAGALALAIAAPLTAADWPQWRGPSRDGRSAEKGLLQSWPAGGPPLAWQAKGFGTGFSTVAVANGRVYTLGDRGEQQFALAASEKDGSPLWQTAIGKAWNDEFLGPRSTPTLDGDRVYVLSTDGDLYCLEAATGKQVWSRNLPADFSGDMMKAKGSYSWKFSESPLIDGDRVIVTPGSRTAALVALDKMTGKTIWQAAIPELGEKGVDGAGYSSAVISEGGGVRHYVQLVGRGVVGIEAATGRFLWSYNKVANEVANIPTPLVFGDHVFASTGYGTGSALIKLSPGPDKGVKAEEVYFLPGEKLQNHHGGMILDGGHVYLGTGHNKGFPIAIEVATGKILWGPERNAGTGSAAVAYADGRLIFRYQNGKVVLISASPQGYQEHGSFDIPGVERPSWPHPVIANGRLYLREQDTLYAYDIKVKG